MLNHFFARLRCVRWVAACLAACIFPLSAASPAAVMPLAGTWGFAMDRADEGISHHWFARQLDQRIALPGALTAQGFGDPITLDTPWTGDIVDRSYFKEPQYEPYRQPGHIKVPFWLQPDRYYKGAAWYQREVNIPAAWAGRRVVVRLERPHWGTTVWVDDHLLGTNVSLATPHEYDASEALTPGKHRLTVRVDNRMIINVGPNSHSVSDHTQGNWNGIVGDLELRATAKVWLDDVQVYPNATAHSARVKVRFGNLTGQPGQGSVRWEIKALKLQGAQAVTWDAAGGAVELEIPLGPDAARWDEFNPALHTLALSLEGAPAGSASAPLDSAQTRFGLREVKRDGSQIAINGRRIFLRGTLECCIFPLTGHPPTDVPAWKRILTIARAHGLNHLRFHSWCPPEAAFVAADELGFYYYVECPSWANSGSSVGDGKPVDQWLYDEGDRMLRAYGNHPSFIMMSYGNEPAGKNQKRWLGDLVTHWKGLDPRRLYTSGAGWPMLPENDFHVTPDPRIQAWGDGLKSRINARPPETTTDYRDFIQKAGQPVVSHEIGQWCVYPNFDEIPKYKGLLKPRNFEIFRDSLRAAGMLDLARPFLLASGKLQTMCYKEEIESALRTPGMAGFELLDLHDFPGQGTALVGVLDPFWDSKGYVTPAEYHRFAGPIVPLARMPKRILKNDETFSAQVEIAHFGARDLAAPQPLWRLRDTSGRIVASGALANAPVLTGVQNPVGEIRVPLAQFTRPTKLNLEVTDARQPVLYANDWDLWVYPARVATEAPREVMVAEELNDAALTWLQKGGKVLLAPPVARIKGDRLGRIRMGLSSIFWNTAWTARQAPHTLGILCDPKHPALREFPTDAHSNWQWWELLSRSHPFIINDTPANFRPVVHAIDDWVTNRKLALVFEARVGSGALLACAMDITNDLDTRPVACQLRRSLMDYMAGPAFRPAQELSPKYIQGLLTSPSKMDKLGARILRTDSEQEGFPAANVIDGNLATIWHTTWGEKAAPFPHKVVLGFQQSASLQGVTLIPRQDNNKNGRIKEYVVYVSEDDKNWGPPVAQGSLANNADPQVITFASSVTGKYLKLEVRSGFDENPFTSLAELEVW
jgi:hypothetical protein